MGNRDGDLDHTDVTSGVLPKEEQRVGQNGSDEQPRHIKPSRGPKKPYKSKNAHERIVTSQKSSDVADTRPTLDPAAKPFTPQGANTQGKPQVPVSTIPHQKKQRMRPHPPTTIQATSSDSGKDKPKVAPVHHKPVQGIPARMPIRPPRPRVGPASTNSVDTETLRQQELKMLEVRYKSSFIRESDRSFVLKITPSDPDFPFEVTGFNLRITEPPGYPQVPCSAELLNTDLPSDVFKNVLLQIQTKINECGNAMLLREVFNWIDKNMEAIILKKPPPVIQFVKFSGPPIIKRAPDDHLQTEKGSMETPPVCEDTKVPIDTSGLDSMDDLNVFHDKSDEESTESKESYPPPLSPDSSHRMVNNEKQSVPSSESSAVTLTEHRGTQIIIDSVTMEMISLVSCFLLRLQLRCLRCQMINDMSCLPNLDSPFQCKQCRTLMTVCFRPSLLHVNSAILGYLDLSHCVPFDLLPSHYILTCMTCSTEMRVKEFPFHTKYEKACHSCHTKFKVVLENYRFVKVADYERPVKATDAVPIRKKKEKDPFTLMPGHPLPDRGTCKHYKKSYRWFRFACCGKVYPCDICHEEKKGDTHEMLLAHRMICGYCSKEQPVANKVCLCGQHMTQVASRYWEGGEGCRNKISMNKNDPHKFKNGDAKTKSKKSSRVGALGKTLREKRV